MGAFNTLLLITGDDMAALINCGGGGGGGGDGESVCSSGYSCTSVYFVFGWLVGGGFILKMKIIFIDYT